MSHTLREKTKTTNTNKATKINFQQLSISCLLNKVLNWKTWIWYLLGVLPICQLLIASRYQDRRHILIYAQSHFCKVGCCVFRPAFGCAQHPKASFHKSRWHSTIKFLISFEFNLRRTFNPFNWAIRKFLRLMRIVARQKLFLIPVKIFDISN